MNSVHTMWLDVARFSFQKLHVVIVVCNKSGSVLNNVTMGHCCNGKTINTGTVIQNDCRGFNNLSYTIHLR